LARRIGRPLLEINGLAHWGLVASFRSPALAVERGRQAIELAQRHGWGGEPLVAIAYPMLAASLIWQGELEEAERWLMEGEYALRSEVDLATGMLFHLVRGFLQIARGRVEEAPAALRAAGRLPRGLFIAAHPPTTEVRAFLLHALAGLGETAPAHAVLTETAESERERPGIRAAVAALRLAQGNPRAVTAALTSVLASSATGSQITGVPDGRTPAAPAAGPPEHLPEPLSQAEVRVLRLLQTSLSAPEIARELYVSVNTVRTHMRHLYDKLGAHRRLEALDRARALGILAPVPQRA
jgi:LuxR family transcriptional regulator, maltose regulon positive regulatory protein